jgi:hypothetical protein
MNKTGKRFSAILLPAAWLATAVVFFGGQPSRTPGEWEAFLRGADVISVTPDENAGRSEPWMVILADGDNRCKSLFKHVDRSRPTALPDSYRYELAAYRLDRLLDLGMVPPTVERVIEDVHGSLQLFIEGCMSLDTVSSETDRETLEDEFKSKMPDMIVFEILTACERSDEDVLLHPESGRICRVDFSQAFNPRPDFSPGRDMQGCSEKLARNLRRVDEASIRAAVQDYLNPEEIAALLERRGRLLERMERPTVFARPDMEKSGSGPIPF